MPSQSKVRAAAVAGCAAALLAQAAVADGFRVGLGAEYTSGDYGGSAQVNQWYVPLMLGYDTRRWGLRLSIPYTRLDAPADTTLISQGPGGSAVIPGSGARETTSGLDDIRASATLYDVYRAPARGLFVDLTGRVKLGTADESSGLGSGENDYALEASAYQRLGHATGVATLGYEINGDPPGLELEDVWYGTLGASFPWTERTRGGVFLDLSQSVIAAQEGPRELSLHLSHRLDRQRSANAYVLTGLSDGSPDWGLGVSFVNRF